MNNCPCCSSPLLLHIRGSEMYWFCRHCWQEMPVMNWEKSSSLAESLIENLTRRIQKQEKANSPISVS